MVASASYFYLTRSDSSLKVEATVFSTAKNCLVVWTLILGMGAHWAILQSVAWTGMVISYSQHGSLRDAFRNTFDGKHPCSMCKAIKCCRRSEQNNDQEKLLLKFDLFVLSSRGAALFPPVLETLRPGVLLAPGWAMDSPPTPPPNLT